jgi:hypothetical protein
MEIATSLIGQIPCHKIGVVPSEAVIDYIIATESKHV